MLTEYRAGTYVYNDAMQVDRRHRHLGRLRHAVRATVVSRPDRRRAMIDAGSKVLT